MHKLDVKNGNSVKKGSFMGKICVAHSAKVFKDSDGSCSQVWVCKKLQNNFKFVNFNKAK